MAGDLPAASPGAWVVPEDEGPEGDRAGEERQDDRRDDEEAAADPLAILPRSDPAGVRRERLVAAHGRASGAGSPLSAM